MRNDGKVYMYTRNVASLFALFCMLLLMTAAAQAQALKVGYVSLGRLIQESPQAIEVSEKLQEEFAPRQREIIALQNDLQKRSEQIQRDFEVMGEEERRNAERDLRRDERELGRSQQELQEDVNLRRNEELGKLQRELLTQVQSYATAQGYDLIVSEGVLYFSASIDITEQVLTGLKASYAAQ